MGCFPSKHRPPAAVSGDVDLPNPAAEIDQIQSHPTNPVEANMSVAEHEQENKERKKLKVFIVFYSMYGHVEKMAKEIKKGVDSTERVEGVLYRVPEPLTSEVLEQMKVQPKNDDDDVNVIVPERLVEADGVLFGFPTRYGSMAAQMKAFFDSTGGMWKEQKLAGLPAGFFVSTGTQGRGQETTA